MNNSKANLLLLFKRFEIKNTVTKIIKMSEPLWGSNLSDIDRKKSDMDEGNPYIEKK